MNFNEKIDLFELTDKIVNRFRNESGLTLSGYEFYFKFKRDWNCPINRIFFNFYIFDDDYGHTVFDKKYNSVDKVIELLLCHLEESFGTDNLKNSLIMAKRYNLEFQTESLTEKIKTISKELLEANNLDPLFTDIDEKIPHCTYENGFPIFQYQISNTTDIKINIDLDFDLRGFDEEEIINQLKKKIKATYNI